MSTPVQPRTPAAPGADPSAPGRPQALRLVLDTWRAVRNHWRAAVAFFLLANGLVLGAIMVCPRAYVSEAKLNVAVGRENATIDPTASAGGQTIGLNDNGRENELNTALDVLGSRAVMEYVATQIGPEPILRGSPLPPRGTAAGAADAAATRDPAEVAGIDRGPLAAIGLSDPVGRFEKAVQDLQEMVEVQANKKSSVVSVRAKADSPRLARRIAEEVIDGFKQEYREAMTISGSYEFFATEAEDVKAALDAAADELTAEKNRLGLSTIEGRRRQLEDRLAATRTALLSQEQDLAAARAELDRYREHLADLPREVDSGTTRMAATGAADATRRQLADLKIRRQELEEKYTDTHPSVKAVNRQIAAAESEIESLADADPQVTRSPNPTWQQLELAMSQKQSAAAGSEAAAATLREQLTGVRREVAELNASETKLRTLEGERDAFAAAYAQTLEKREQARVGRKLGEAAISSVNVFQPASFNAKPVSPNKRLIAAAGLLFAGFGGLGLALFLEYRDLFAAALDPRPQPADRRAAVRAAADRRGAAGRYEPAAPARTRPTAVPAGTFAASPAPPDPSPAHAAVVAAGLRGDLPDPTDGSESGRHLNGAAFDPGPR